MPTPEEMCLKLFVLITYFIYQLNLLIKTINNSLIKIIKYCVRILINSLKFTILWFISRIKHNIKLNVKFIVKVLCLSVLFYGGIEVTKEYFSYPYVYRLSVKPSERLDLPPITVCTEKRVFFDKSRINRYFNVSLESNKQQVNHEINKVFKLCQTIMESIDCIESIDYVIYHYVINQFYWEYQNKLLTNYTFSELYNKFTIKSNELIKCSAKLHSKDKTNSNNNNSSDSQVMTDCSQSYAVLETIYGNKDFGICFTYFYTNHYNYYLIDDDFIQFDISFETQQKFISSGYYDEYYNKIYDSFIQDPYLLFNVRDLHFKDNFGLYIFVNPMTEPLMASKETSSKTTKIGLNGRLKITSTHLQLLSKPYMKSCREYGIVYYVTLYNSIII